MVNRISGNETCSVIIHYNILNKKYNKIIKKTMNIKAHNENNISKVGDIVFVKYYKKISKTKSWTIIRND